MRSFPSSGPEIAGSSGVAAPAVRQHDEPLDEVIEVSWFRTDVAGDHCRTLLNRLSEAERARASRFRFDRDRSRYVAAHAHLRRVLARFTGREPSGLTLATAAHGKPFLLAEPPMVGPQFSLSYSGDFCVVAIATRALVGVDIERISPLADDEPIGEHCSASERHWLATLPDAQKLRGFYRCWTLKEALLKAEGLGLAIPLNRVGVISSAGDVVVETGPELTGTYNLRELAAPDGYSGALCVRDCAHCVVVVDPDLHSA